MNNYSSNLKCNTIIQDINNKLFERPFKSNLKIGRLKIYILKMYGPNTCIFKNLGTKHLLFESW